MRIQGIKDSKHEKEMPKDMLPDSYLTCEGIKRHQWGRRGPKFWKVMMKRKAKMGKRRNRKQQQKTCREAKLFMDIVKVHHSVQNKTYKSCFKKTLLAKSQINVWCIFCPFKYGSPLLRKVSTQDTFKIF